MQPLVKAFAERRRIFLRTWLAFALLATVFGGIAGIPRSAAASGCSRSVSAPWVSGSLWGWGSASCSGDYRFGMQVCLRKQRNNQPDEDTTCTPNRYFYTNWNEYVSQCNATSNYRTRVYTWYDVTGASAGRSESAWVNVYARC